MTALINFLSINFLENTLTQFFKKVIKIQKFDAKIENVDDHYCSSMVNITISYRTDDSEEDQQFSIMAKIFPEDKDSVHFVTAMNCFESEMGIYGDVFPAIYNLEYQQKISPKAVAILSKPTPALLLENLKPLGYKTANSQEGLDLQHCLLVLDKLAYLHAASVAIHEKDANMIKRYNVGMFLPGEITKFQVSVTLSTLRKVCQKIPDLQIYASKLCLDEVIDKIYASRRMSQNFNVLNHGDLWIKNLMFNYGANQNVQDVMFLDYQLPFFSSPALDLHYFWACCTNQDVKLNYKEYIFSYYYHTLIRTLLKLRVSVVPPTMDEFMEDFRARAGFGFAATLIFLPVQKNALTTPWDTYLTDEREDCFRNASFANENYVKHVKLLLPLYDNSGLFN